MGKRIGLLMATRGRREFHTKLWMQGDVLLVGVDCRRILYATKGREKYVGVTGWRLDNRLGLKIIPALILC